MYGWSARRQADHKRRRQAVTLMTEHAPDRVIYPYDDAYWAVESALAALRIALRRCDLTAGNCAEVDVATRSAILNCVQEAKHGRPRA